MVSIIVVTYNSGKTLIETLDSIYNQTYQELELIISDDGSKDETVSLAEEWILKHKTRFIKTKIIQSKNTGVTKNCNRGVRAASGEFIQLIAGDDILLENAIEIKLNHLLTYGCDIVFCKVEPFGENKEQVKKMESFCENGYKIIKKGYECQKENILIDNFIAGPSGNFYTAEFIKEMNGYDERYPMLEDYPFLYHYIYKGNAIVLIDKILVKYRISSNSLCTKKGSPMDLSQAYFFFNERLKELLKQKKYIIAFKQSLIFWKKRILHAINYY